MYATLQKIIVPALIMLLTADNIISVNITGETEVNGTYGSNVNITWKIKTQAGKRLLLEIFVNNTKNENQLFLIITDPSISGVFGKGQSSKDVAQRSSAFYHTGRIVEGEVVLTIRNLRLDDSNEYILKDIVDQKNLKKTVLSVNSPLVLSGKNLNERYNAKSGDFTLKLAFLGNPRPEVTWTLDGLSILTTVLQNSPYNYTYTVTIEADNLPAPCSSKQLNYTATGYGGSITGFTTIYGGFVRGERSFIENIEFLRFQNSIHTCVNTMWNNEVESGKCDVQYQVDFFDMEGAPIRSMNVTDTLFSVCNMSDTIKTYKNLTITTHVYAGNGTILAVEKSESQQFPSSTTTTITAPVSTATTTKDSLKYDEKSSKNEKELRSKTVIIIALVVILAVLAIAILLLIVLVKIGKVEMKLISHKNCKSSSKNQEYQENILDVNTVMNPPSDYMELQAVRKDTTYQALTSVQSTPDPTKENSLYEVY